ncbi:hypothetical protein [Leptolyngbya sp. FACHB-261]|uniref:hypothetical protein n=1 Tax=Leptolyngbya sp. FACHB-261 TaxID=2692806 RepID=UPI0016873339|nr:hypothetical protein [Leptolyngbya sp. FACHB-261]MBD2102857.1 hypothetical protein [Leptolyngbya sp. FACHB-261]
MGNTLITFLVLGLLLVAVLSPLSALSLLMLFLLAATVLTVFWSLVQVLFTGSQRQSTDPD